MNMHVTAEQGWTEERIERLRAMVKDGLSGRQIATALGVTRNAVIGKASRLKLGLHGKGVREPAPKSPNRGNATAGSILRRLAARKEQEARSESKVMPRLPTYRASAVDEPGVDCTYLLGLNSHTCRWPVGAVTGAGQLFCGARRAEGSSYCAEHKARSRLAV